MLVDGDVGDALDVGARQPDLRVAPAVVCGLVAAAVPREVVDFDEETVVGQPEIGMDDHPVADVHGMLARERREAASTHGPLEAQLMVRPHRSPPAVGSLAVA